MKKILLILIVFSSIGMLKSQEIQSTIVKQSQHCIKIFAKPNGNINDIPFNQVIALRWPDQAPSTVNAVITELLPGLVNSDDPVQHHTENGFTYSEYNIGQAGNPPSINWISGTEYQIAKICFEGDAPGLEKIQQIDEDGGSSGWVYWYIDFQNGGDMTNYANPFYESPGKSTVDNSNAGGTQYAQTTEDVAVPLSLDNFFAKKHNNTSSIISWNSYNEVNFDNFVLERSFDNDNWSSLTSILGKGRKDNSYSYIDQDVYNGEGNQTYYYRLKMVDLDGQFEYSDSRSVNFDSKDFVGLDVFPNPSSDKVYFNLKGIKKGSELNVRLLDNIGKTIISKKVIYQSNNNLIIDNSSNNFKSGVYHFIIEDETGKKLIKKIVLTK